MHLGKQHSPEDYFIAGKNIGVSECERDLGVLVSSDDTYHKQVNSTASKPHETITPSSLREETRKTRFG